MTTLYNWWQPFRFFFHQQPRTPETPGGRLYTLQGSEYKQRRQPQRLNNKKSSGEKNAECLEKGDKKKTINNKKMKKTRRQAPAAPKKKTKKTKKRVNKLLLLLLPAAFAHDESDVVPSKLGVVQLLDHVLHLVQGVELHQPVALSIDLHVPRLGVLAKQASKTTQQYKTKQNTQHRARSHRGAHETDTPKANERRGHYSFVPCSSAWFITRPPHPTAQDLPAANDAYLIPVSPRSTRRIFPLVTRNASVSFQKR